MNSKKKNKVDKEEIKKLKDQKEKAVKDHKIVYKNG